MTYLTKEAAQSVLETLKYIWDKYAATLPIEKAIATMQAAIDAPPPSGERAALLSRLANVRAMAYDRLPSCDVQTIDDVMGVLAADAQRGEIVVTRTQDGRLAAVTRQDDEGRILSVIAEADAPEQEPTDKEIAAVMRILPPWKEPVARWALSCDDIRFMFTQLYTAPPVPQSAEQALRQIAEFGELQNKAPQARDVSDADIDLIFNKHHNAQETPWANYRRFARAVLAARSGS